jgi:hypothetical protein
MGRELLTLDTLEPDRDFVAINGKPYYLRNDEELSLVEIARVRRLSKSVMEKGSLLDLEDAELAQVDEYANQILEVIILGLEPELLGKLSTSQKFMISRAFMTASSKRRAGTQAQAGEARPTTDSSSPGSSGSTEAVPATG